MKKSLSCLFQFCLLVSFVVCAQAAGPLDWPAEKTKVLVVGILEWEDAESYAPFPKEDRRDVQLVEWLKKSGVPAKNIIYLQDKKATLSAIKKALNQTLESSQAGDQLIIYYCGHGSENDAGNDTTLAPYNAGVNGVEEWSVNEMIQTTDNNFEGDRVAVFLDCCHAGGIKRAVKNYGRNNSYMGFGSSTSGATSTENWTFTETVLLGLQGDASADITKDGTITVGDLQKFIASEMLFAEDQKSDAVTLGDCTIETPLAKAKPPLNAKAGKHVVVTVEGEDWKARVLNTRPGEVEVFYYGYEAADTEWVKDAQVKWIK